MISTYCIQYIHMLFTRYPYDIYILYTRYPYVVHKISIWYLHIVYKISIRYIHIVYKISICCSQDIHMISTYCILDIHMLFTRYPYDIYILYTRYPYDIYILFAGSIYCSPKEDFLRGLNREISKGHTDCKRSSLWADTVIIRHGQRVFRLALAYPTPSGGFYTETNNKRHTVICEERPLKNEAF